jgi:hypothetical protein
VIRPVAATILVLTALVAGCSGDDSSSTGVPVSTPTAISESETLPAEGTARLPDGRVYTVVPAGQTLELEDIGLRIDRLRWRNDAGVSMPPLGTMTYAVVTVTVENRGSEQASVQPTQIWLLSATNHAFLPANETNVPRSVLMRSLEPGQKLTGTLVFPLPRRTGGGLLVYPFADAAAIATAKDVGVARF